MQGSPDLFCAYRFNFFARAQIFPALQRDRDVAVFPDKIVEGTKIKLLALFQARFGQ